MRFADGGKRHGLHTGLQGAGPSTGERGRPTYEGPDQMVQCTQPGWLGSAWLGSAPSRPHREQAHEAKARHEHGQLEGEVRAVAHLLRYDLHEGHVQKGACMGAWRRMTGRMSLQRMSACDSLNEGHGLEGALRGGRCVGACHHSA